MTKETLPALVFWGLIGLSQLNSLSKQAYISPLKYGLIRVQLASIEKAHKQTFYKYYNLSFSETHL